MGRPKGSPNKAGRKDAIKLTLELKRSVVESADAHAEAAELSRTAAIEDLIERGYRSASLAARAS